MTEQGRGAVAPQLQQLIDLITQLAELTGPAGHEGPVRQAIEAVVQPHVDEVWTDALGNLFARRRPSASSGEPLRVMLAAHMDEIGLIATHIDDNGFVRFAPVGGVSPVVLLGQRVRFAGSGALGVVGSEHLEDAAKELKHERLFIDIGASSAEQARQMVQVGDMAAYVRPVERLHDGRLVGKSLDDRVGCAVVAQALRELPETPHDVYAVFTVQEEVGARGARPAAFRIAPDIALAVDVTATGDTPKSRVLPMALGKGVAIKVKDMSMVAHPGVRRLLVERASEHGIAHQMEVLDFGGTDAGPIHTSRDGVPTGVLSIPTRYLHTPAEVLDVRDARAAVDLLVQVLRHPITL